MSGRAKAFAVTGIRSHDRPTRSEFSKGDIYRIDIVVQNLRIMNSKMGEVLILSLSQTPMF